MADVATKNDGRVMDLGWEPNEPTKVGYKVVWSGAKKPRKVFEPVTGDSLQKIRYEIGRWTVQDPENYGPFGLFDTLEHAQEYVESRDFDGYYFVRCDYVENREDKEMWKRLPPEWEAYKGYDRKWHYYAVSAGTVERELEECPDGTVFAKAVRLVEILDR